MKRLPQFSTARMVALAGLGSAMFAGSQGEWVLGGTALGVGLGVLALPRKSKGKQSVANSPVASIISRPPSPPRELLQDKLAALLQNGDDIDCLVAELLSQGRVALLLRPELSASLHENHLQYAQQVLDETMSLVPGGEVVMHSRWLETGHGDNGAGRTLTHVEATFLDRFTVTNRDYQHFVDAGGYSLMELWEPSIWPAMVEFVDQSGKPAPRYWSEGKHRPGLGDHPVVGVSWYEAAAYARWVGKRLPTDAEWVKAGAWPVGTAPQQRRYPWGDVFDRSLANVWGSSNNTTAPVDDFPGGTSVGGVWQLVGNVWEWTSTAWGAWEPSTKKAETTVPMRSLRGGAFDTYFESQAACQFQSGDDPLARRHNVGFRCALSWDDVASDSSAATPEDSEQNA